MLRIKDPIQECCDLLHEHKCLVVIDGLQSKEEWNLIKGALALGAAESPTNSRIIVITNEESVATCCATTMWNMKGLEIDEALDLFKRKVLEKTHVHRALDRTVIEQAKRILPMCGGLPRVIVAIAEFYASTTTNKLNTGKNLENWMMLSDSFIYKLETERAFGSLRGLFSWLHAYFHTCPDLLKPCIFYLSIFPVNHIIRRRRLVRRWIAEGYSRDMKDSTAEETAEQFFSKLMKLSMIQMLGSTVLDSFVRMSLCQVNGFFREYIISRSMEENLVFALQGHCTMNSQRTGRHLAIERMWDRDRNVFESIDLSWLRSLTVFGDWRSFFISDKMRLLRVLDLENASAVKNGDLEEMVKRLPRLKFLSLRGCKAVTRLPNSLGGLRQLQTLDIRDTSVITLPKRVIKLQKLQYIRAGTTVQLDAATGTVESLPGTSERLSLFMPSMDRPHGSLVSRLSESCICRRLVDSHNGSVKVPRGIKRLTDLHTLGVIDVSGARGKAPLKELKTLTQLRKLGVSGINLNNSHEFFGNISRHCHLESLSIQLDNDNEGCLDGFYPYLQNLRNLKLYGLVGKLPLWLRHLCNLRKLTLQMTTMLPKGEIDPLGDLPKLAVLCLRSRSFKKVSSSFTEV